MPATPNMAVTSPVRVSSECANGQVRLVGVGRRGSPNGMRASQGTGMLSGGAKGTLTVVLVHNDTIASASATTIIQLFIQAESNITLTLLRYVFTQRVINRTTCIHEHPRDCRTTQVLPHLPPPPPESTTSTRPPVTAVCEISIIDS